MIKCIVRHRTRAPRRHRRRLNAPPTRRELGRRNAVRHPAIAKSPNPTQRQFRPANPRHPRSQPLRICGQPDRARRLHRLRLKRHPRETIKPAVERLAILRPQMPQHLHMLDHPPPPVRRILPERAAFRLPRRIAAAACARHQPRTPARQHVQTCPFISKRPRFPQGKTAHARRPEQHPFGPPCHRRQQRQRIEPPIDEQRVADPHAVDQRASLGRVRHAQQVARRAHAQQHATVGKSDAEPQCHRPHATTARCPRKHRNDTTFIQSPR